MSDRQPVGVLVMAYGGPSRVEEIPGYLADIRSGRPTTRSVLEEITRNYRSIGGASPLLARSRLQADAIGERLDGERFRIYLGMRHWAPWIEETVRDMLADSIQRAVAIVLAPHFSTLSVAKYQERIHAGLEMYRGHIDFEFIDSYHDVPGLIGPLAARVRDGLSHWPEGDRDGVHVVFSAHSLPVRIVKMGDPYDSQLRETAALVAEAAGLAASRWSWSYQSAGRSPEPWLGPQLEDYLRELAARGIRDVLVVPVGFVSDHVEILYDIDIEAQAAAAQCGIRLERPPALNDDPVFIEQLADLIRERTARRGWLDDPRDTAPSRSTSHGPR